MRVLVVNAGSSSLKLAVVEPRGIQGEASLDAPRAEVDRVELERALTGLPRADAVGHRIVHGGRRIDPAIIDDALVAELEALTELAPLHQPKSLRALRDVSTLLADLPAVACFDTAFHATIPEAAATYALPAEWRARYGLRRYGFHGLSHAYAARRVAELAGHRPTRLVSCHLGAGASLAAIRDGVCIDTTMGFTPLEGLVMATRSGSVDPGLVLWLLDPRRLGHGEVAEGLEHRSGLLGLAGTADMRELLTRDDPEARLALDVYVHRLRAEVAAMAAALGGLDALVFTGGVGEHAPEIRHRLADGLAFLGVVIDAMRNEDGRPDREISPEGAHVGTFVLRAGEGIEIARQVRCLLDGR